MIKKLPKFLIIFFLAVFLIQIICLFFFLAAPAAGRAAGVQYAPQVQLNDYKFNPSDTSTGNIARYVFAIYKYAIGIIGIVAAVVLMVGGVMWIMAGGSATAIGEAKAWIGAALTGLVLALASYLILATVNPALVNLRTTDITRVKDSGTSAKADATVACGQQLPGAESICGSKCAEGQNCQKVAEGTAGAKNCINGSDDWWICSSIVVGASGCCTGNNDSECPSGYICNMQMITGSCLGKGTCSTKQLTNGICGENNDCLGNNCDSNRCK